MERKELRAAAAPPRFTICRMHTLQTEARGAFKSFKEDVAVAGPHKFTYSPSPLAPHLTAYPYAYLHPPTPMPTPAGPGA